MRSEKLGTEPYELSNPFLDSFGFASDDLTDVLTRDLATKLHASHRTANPKKRQMLNQAILAGVVAADRKVSGDEYEWPFGFMPKCYFGGSSTNRQVELRGFEPLTP